MRSRAGCWRPLSEIKKLMSRVAEESRRRVLQDVLVSEDKMLAVETEMLEASEEMRELVVGKRMTKGFGF